MAGPWRRSTELTTLWECLRTLPAVTSDLGTSKSMQSKFLQGRTICENQGILARSTASLGSLCRFSLGDVTSTSTLSYDITFALAVSLVHGNGISTSWAICLGWSLGWWNKDPFRVYRKRKRSAYTDIPKKRIWFFVAGLNSRNVESASRVAQCFRGIAL